jgi:hypothetical protein
MRVHFGVVAVLLAACTAAPSGVKPIGLLPATREQVQGWVSATQPGKPLSIDFGAVFTSKQYDAARGSGHISILPPDSLRFDFRGPLGSARSAAAVVGDSALWAEPKEDVEKMVPSYPLLWAMVGVARPPRAGEGMRGLQDGDQTVWQYVRAADTVTYIRTTREFRAEVVRDGKQIGRVRATYGPDGVLTKARLDVTSPQARLEITFRKVSSVNGFDKGIWNAPEH